MMFRIVFWDVLPCKMIVVGRFRGAYCLHHQGWVIPEDNSEQAPICRDPQLCAKRSLSSVMLRLVVW
jgi:hypothetical protein